MSEQNTNATETNTESQAMEPQNAGSQTVEPQSAKPQAMEPQATGSQTPKPQPPEPQAPAKSGSGKKLIIGFSIMGVVVVILLVALLAAVLENNKLRQSASPGSESSSLQASAPAESKESESAEPTDAEPGSEETKESASDDASSESASKEDESSAEPSQTEPESEEESSEEPETSEPDEITEGELVLTYSTGNSWDNGSTKMNGLEMKITNNTDTAIDGWKLVVTVDKLVSAEGWNGTYTVQGDELTITNAEHNKQLSPGGSAYIGCNIGTGTSLSLVSATLNGTACTIEKGKVDQNEQNNQNNNNNNGNKKVDVSALLDRPKEAKQGDDWLFTDGNKIVDKDGKQVWLTGVNWFGYNTGTNTFDGLWNSRLEPTVKGIADHGFNLIRVPISAQLINQWAAGDYPRANYNNAYNDELNSMNSLEIFDYFLKLAEQNGIKVMPDIHSAETDAAGHNANLWYTDKVSVEEYYAALEWMADRYKDNDTIIAFDLKNEPHGKPNEGKKAAIWNDSKDANNWKYVAETAASRVLAKNPNVLILVEGTEIYPKKKGGNYSSTDSEDYYFNWWGGNLRAVAEYPIDLGKYQNKLVYSPHDYGPTVYAQPWFEGNYTYESLMKDCWYDNWLYIHDKNIAPLLIGEWGGFMREPNLTWMTYMRQLIKTYHLNHTFWCLNANSGDTGGLLLDDFTTWDSEKYDFVKEVLWQENGKFVGLDHAIPLGNKGITLTNAKGLK